MKTVAHIDHESLCESLSLLESVWIYSFLVNVNIEDEWGEHPTISFNDDGTIKDTQLEIVNLKMNRQWEPVG